MPIFASSGAFLKPGEAENKRTIQTEVNTHGSMLIVVVTTCQNKIRKSMQIYVILLDKTPFDFMQVNKSVNKLLKYAVKTSYGHLIGKWGMV